MILIGSFIELYQTDEIIAKLTAARQRFNKHPFIFTNSWGCALTLEVFINYNEKPKNEWDLKFGSELQYMEILRRANF